jgi:hypothetical protein
MWKKERAVKEIGKGKIPCAWVQIGLEKGFYLVIPTHYLSSGQLREIN